MRLDDGRPDASAPVTRNDLSPDEQHVLRRYRSWARFQRGPRKEAPRLLAALPKYPDCVLVSGCQRSGTTMLTRIIAGAAGFRRFALTHDDELDAALALAGYIELPAGSRYCFQTTYLNERYPEYETLKPGQKLIWLLRNPYSVIYSMVYHWRRSARNRLYESCMADQPDLQRLRRHKVWQFRLGRAEKACIAYRGKAEQIFKIREVLSKSQLLILEYDDLIQSKEAAFSRVFRFIAERYQPQYVQSVRPDSLNKAQQLSPDERALVERIAMPAYEQSRQLIAVQ